MEGAIQRQIENAIDAGEGDVLAQNLRRRVAASPSDLSARLDLAAHYAAAGFPEVALEHYRIASQAHPDDARVAVLLAKTLRGMKLNSEAKLRLEAFAARNSNTPAELWSWLGMAQDDAGDLQAAEKSHRSAVALQPGADSLHNNLGYNLLLQNKEAEAAEEFRKALSIAPNSAIAQNNLGLALAGKPGEAVSTLRSVADRATAHSNLAAILIEQGKYVEARRQLNLALGYKKDHAPALRNLQLLSELDGGSVTIPVPSGDTGWKRFRSGLRLLFLGEPDPADAKRTVDTASR